MTTKDKELIQQAFASLDYQEIDRLIPEAESDECRDQLKSRSRYLYKKEEAFAGIN